MKHTIHNHSWKFIATFVILLPLVFFRPVFSFASLENFFGYDSPSAQAYAMYEQGARYPIMVTQIPTNILHHITQTGEDNGCFLQRAAKVYLGVPQKIAGYEVVLACPQSQEPFVGLYYNNAEQFLDTIAIGYH